MTTITMTMTTPSNKGTPTQLPSPFCDLPKYSEPIIVRVNKRNSFNTIKSNRDRQRERKGSERMSRGRENGRRDEKNGEKWRRREQQRLKNSGRAWGKVEESELERKRME